MSPNDVVLHGEGVRSGIHSKKILIRSAPSGRDFL